jgi:transposase-like protein
MTRTDLWTDNREFRAGMVELVLERGLRLETAVQWLSVPNGTLANWGQVANCESTASTSAPGSHCVAEVEADHAELLDAPGFRSLRLEFDENPWSTPAGLATSSMRACCAG